MPQGGSVEKGGGETGLVEIGFVRKPVGLKGWCGVTAHGDTLPNLETPCRVYVGPDARSAVEQVLEEVKPGPKGCRCLFSGCEDRDGAEKFRNRLILIDRQRLPPLEGGRYYHFELKGMNVVSSRDKTILGTVVGVHNYPSVDAIEVRGNDGRSAIVPITGDMIESVDRGAATITIKAQRLDGLFE